jgi:NADPH:quinone reductase
VKAVCIEQAAHGPALAIRDIDEPVAGPRDILVSVRTAGLNRADLRRASAHFASSQGAPGSAIAGLEMAGEVVLVGDEVDGVAVGDRVMAMTGRAWAERVAVDHRLVVPVPSTFDWRQAAATPISFITAHDALSAAAGLVPGETVLVQGATSSAGIAAVQLAAAMGARLVVGTSTSAWKVDALRDLGCEALDAATDITAALSELTDGHGADVVIDIVGQGVVQQNIDAAAVRGRIVCLGRLAGTRGEFDLDEFSRKRIQMIGVTFRTRTLDERFLVVSRFRNVALPLLTSAAVRPVVDRSFPLDAVEEAENYMKTSHGFGKVVIDVTDVASA